MKERPILFSAPMVRALLAGTKTQTRRVVNERSHQLLSAAAQVGECHALDAISPATINDQATWAQFCPYGAPGDRLWVRETWAHSIHAMAAMSDEDGPFVYAATHRVDQRLGEKWRPSIHMPRYACRLKLEITGVRVERLNAISDVDALSEGIDRHDVLTDGDPPPGWHRGTFEKLWERINGPESWVANPWVWVVEFKRIGA